MKPMSVLGLRGLLRSGFPPPGFDKRPEMARKRRIRTYLGYFADALSTPYRPFLPCFGPVFL